MIKTKELNINLILAMLEKGNIEVNMVSNDKDKTRKFICDLVAGRKHNNYSGQFIHLDKKRGRRLGFFNNKKLMTDLYLDYCDDFQFDKDTFSCKFFYNCPSNDFSYNISIRIIR